MRRIGHALVYASTKGLSRQEWLKLRAGGVGGSDIAKIAGVSQWGNALTVYLSKIDPLYDDGEQSEAAEIGTEVEDVVARLWMRRNPGLKLERVNAILQHPDHPWALANIDRVVIAAGTNQVIGVWEGKSGGTKAGWGEDDVPAEYELQGAWYLAVTGLPKVYFGALLGGYGGHVLACRERDADPALIDDLLVIGEEFWKDNVLRREPPAVDGSEASTEALRRLYPEARLPSLELPPSVDLKAAAYLDAQQAVKTAEAARDLLGNELRLLLGDHEAALCPGFQLSWPNVTTNRLDGKALAKDHPELVAQYTKPSQSRRFTVKPRKER